jgi:hypothetical protein
MNCSRVELRFVGGAIRVVAVSELGGLVFADPRVAALRAERAMLCAILSAQLLGAVFRSRLFYIGVTMCHRSDRAFLAVPCQPAPAALT